MRLHILLTAVMLLPLAFSLSVTFDVYPKKPVPGDAVRVTALLSGYALNVELKVLDPLFGTDTWIELGDVSGNSMPVFYITLPENIKPGYYQIPVEVRFEENSVRYNVRTHIPVYVIPEEKDVEIDVYGRLVKGVKNNINVTVKVNGEPLRNAVVKLIPSLEGSKEYGLIKNQKTFTFTVIPECKKGVQEFNVVIEGFRNEKVTFFRTIKKICSKQDGIAVEANIPRTLTPGEHTVELKLINNFDIPKEITVVTSSNVLLGGKTSLPLHIDGRSVERIPVTLIIPDDATSVELVVNVVSDDFNRVFRFSSIVYNPPEIIVYFKGYRDKKPLIEVANAGGGEAENVIVYINNSPYFIGTLTSGDYDSIEVEFAGDVNVLLSYNYLGKKYTRQVTLNIPKKDDGGITPVYLLTGGLILAIIIYWFRRRSRD